MFNFWRFFFFLFKLVFMLFMIVRIFLCFRLCYVVFFSLSFFKKCSIFFFEDRRLVSSLLILVRVCLSFVLSVDIIGVVFVCWLSCFGWFNIFFILFDVF